MLGFGCLAYGFYVILESMMLGFGYTRVCMKLLMVCMKL